jgi:hypothetical protein
MLEKDLLVELQKTASALGEVQKALTENEVNTKQASNNLGAGHLAQIYTQVETDRYLKALLGT